MRRSNSFTPENLIERFKVENNNYKMVDLTGIKTKAELFDRIEDGLDLPVYFGKNLDALHDMLAYSDMTLIIIGFADAKEALGDYAEALAGMLIDTEAESKNFRVIIR